MPRLNEGGLDLLRAWIKQSKTPKLIVIDVLAKVRDPRKKDQGLYDGDYAALQGLKALADEFHIAIVVVHHLRKMDAEDPLDQISGTTGLSAGVDTVLVLYRAAVGVILTGRGRDLEDINKAVRFQKDCTWTVLGEPAETTQSAKRAAILKVLLEAKAPMTPADISKLVGMSLDNARQPYGQRGRGAPLWLRQLHPP
jgi:hypothetical protein